MTDHNKAIVRRYQALLRERDNARRINDHKTNRRITDELTRIRPSVEAALNAIAENPAPERPDPSPEELFLLGRVAELNAEVERLRRMLLGETPIDPVYLEMVQAARARARVARVEWS